MRLIIFLIAIGCFLAFLHHQFPYALNSDEQKSNAIYYTILLLVVGAGLLSRPEISLKHHLKYALAWLAIIIVIMIGYSFRDDIMQSRFIAELMPCQARMNASGEVVLHASEDGHFYLEAMVNNTPIRFLVDTGASNISLSREDAVRVGIDVDSLTYNIPYSTANGTSFNASATINTLEVAGMLFENLPVSINKGRMDMSLLGMSFLRQFSSYHFQNDRLILIP